MSIRQAPTGDFRADLMAMLPRLRIYVLALTRDADRADDLVQQTVPRARIAAAGRPRSFPGRRLRRHRPCCRSVATLAGRWLRRRP
jgi:DNA-directed RNA polymerase specialized sigma24 family protein